MTTQRLTLTPTQTAASVRFRRDTQLRNCTRLDATNDGEPCIVMESPAPSSGEQTLWAVLSWLNGYENLPARWDIESLDEPNMRVVEALLEQERAA